MHIIYRINTDEVFNGYDCNGKPMWLPFEHLSEAMSFPDKSAAETNCKVLEGRGFYVIAESYRLEKVHG